MEIKASITFHYDISTDGNEDEFDLSAESKDDALRLARELFVEDVQDMVLKYPEELFAGTDLETDEDEA